MSEARAEAPAGRTDEEWLREAIDVSRRCSPSMGAYCVGAIVVAASGTEHYSKLLKPFGVEGMG